MQSHLSYCATLVLCKCSDSVLSGWLYVMLWSSLTRSALHEHKCIFVAVTEDTGCVGSAEICVVTGLSLAWTIWPVEWAHSRRRVVRLARTNGHRRTHVKTSTCRWLSSLHASFVHYVNKKTEYTWGVMLKDSGSGFLWVFMNDNEMDKNVSLQ